MDQNHQDQDHLRAKSGCIYIIGCLLRPGTLSFATQLEHDYFSPDTDENDLYQIFQLQYSGMPFYIIEVPHHSFQIAETLAEQLGLKMVRGKPTSTHNVPFGLLCSADMCFTLETDHQNVASEPQDWSEQLKDEQVRVRERLKMTITDVNNE